MEALPAISEVLCEGWMVKSPPVPPVETKIIPGYSLFKAVRIFSKIVFSDYAKVTKAVSQFLGLCWTFSLKTLGLIVT